MKVKIRPVGNFGVYFAVRKNEVVSDFTNDTIVEIESPCVLAGNQVFIEMDDFWAALMRLDIGNTPRPIM